MHVREVFFEYSHKTLVREMQSELKNKKCNRAVPKEHFKIYPRVSTLNAPMKISQKVTTIGCKRG